MIWAEAEVVILKSSRAIKTLVAIKSRIREQFSSQSDTWIKDMRLFFEDGTIRIVDVI